MGLKKRIEDLEGQIYSKMEEQAGGKGETLEVKFFQAARRAVLQEMTDQELEQMEGAVRAQKSGQPMTAEQLGITQVFSSRMSLKLGRNEHRKAA